MKFHSFALKIFSFSNYSIVRKRREPESLLTNSKKTSTTYHMYIEYFTQNVPSIESFFFSNSKTLDFDLPGLRLSFFTIMSSIKTIFKLSKTHLVFVFKFVFTWFESSIISVSFDYQENACTLYYDFNQIFFTILHLAYANRKNTQILSLADRNLRSL